MRIYFLRHGIAEERSWDESDDLRSLTALGARLVELEAKALKRIGVRFDRILTSPLLRAKQTARIVASVLAIEGVLKEEARLAGGFGMGYLQTIATANSDVDRLLLVGHEPGFSQVIGALIGGASVDMKKGGLACVFCDRIEPGAGVLRWLITSDVLVQGGDKA